MTKEEVLQKANDYCNEKGYKSETLTDDFKDKFSELFARRYSEETAVDADGVVSDMKFSLDSAFSATSKWAKHRMSEFEVKENEYKRQIAELGAGKLSEKQPQQMPAVLPDDLRQKLDRLERFEEEKRMTDKFTSVLALAKKGVRQDLHKSLETYARDFKVTLEGGDEEQARMLTERFQEIFKDSIGDIKPLAPRQTRKQDEEFLSSLPKIKV